MAARAEGLQLPSTLVRWLSPAVGTALFAALATLIKHRLEHISVPRMSDEWLLNHERDTRESQ
jgi:hypothetical protein